MYTTLTSKGQVTIPKHIRDALHLLSGNAVEFLVNNEGQVVLQKVDFQKKSSRDRFDEVRGKADIKWRTDELMTLLRDHD